MHARTHAFTLFVDRNDPFSAASVLESKIVNVQEDVFIVKAAHHQVYFISNMRFWARRFDSATKWTQMDLVVWFSLGW